MGIELKTSQAKIEKMIAKKVDNVKKAIIYNLSYIGERCVTEAREKTPDEGSFTDQTGNLRSSIGYAIVCDGVTVQTYGFLPTEKGSKKGVDGQKDGQNFLNEIIRKFPKDIVLILVAGMNYATYVARYKDVIDSAELLAKKLIPEMMGDLLK